MARIVRILLLAAGAAVATVLVIRIGPSTIAGMLRSVGWGFAAVSGIYFVHIAVRAWALWRSMPDASLRYREVLAVRLAGEAVEMLTFTGPFLAEPAKGYLLQRRGLAGAHAYGAVAIEYLLYTLVSAWMAAAALTMLLARDVVPDALRAPVAGIVAATGAFTAGCAAAAISGRGLIAPSIDALLRPFGPRRAADLRARVAGVEAVLVGFMHERTARLVEVVAIEVVGQALLASEVWVIFRALGFAAGAAVPLVFEGGVKFIGAAFFFIPGQVGAQEGVYSLLARMLGYPAAAGLTLALVRRIRALIVAGAGLAVTTALRVWSPPDRRSTRSGC